MDVNSVSAGNGGANNVVSGGAINAVDGGAANVVGAGSGGAMNVVGGAAINAIGRGATNVVGGDEKMDTDSAIEMVTGMGVNENVPRENQRGAIVGAANSGSKTIEIKGEKEKGSVQFNVDGAVGGVSGGGEGDVSVGANIGGE